MSARVVVSVRGGGWHSKDWRSEVLARLMSVRALIEACTNSFLV